VPLSTSSSSDRIPDAPYVSQWFVTVAVFLLCVIIGECYWRYRGFSPDVADTKDFWCQCRNNVYGTSPRSVLVIAGLSRAHIGLVPSVMETEIPELKVVQLAIDGTSPWNVVYDLCRDDQFNGILLLSTIFGLGTETPPDRELEYIDHYHRRFAPCRFVDRRINTAIGVRLQSRMDIFSASLSFPRLANGRFHIRPQYVTMLANRYRPAYYRERMTPEELSRYRKYRVQRATRETRRVDRKDFEIGMSRLRGMNEELLSRGGKMVMVRMPTTAEHWEADQKRAPKDLFWDRVTRLSGVPTIHFSDYEILRSFDCPDTSHLDASDAPEFTRRLVSVLLDELGI
jgi:hypothetical protein